MIAGPGAVVFTPAAMESALTQVHPALNGVLETRAIRHILSGVEPMDVATYVAVIMLILAVVTAASWLPAHRAAGTDPLALLRREQ